MNTRANQGPGPSNAPAFIFISSVHTEELSPPHLSPAAPAPTRTSPLGGAAARCVCVCVSVCVCVCVCARARAREYYADARWARAVVRAREGA